MIFYDCWFVKYDQFILFKEANIIQMKKILLNRPVQFTECYQSNNTQLHLYQIIRFIDYFFIKENLIDIIDFQIDEFTDKQIKQIQTCITQFRIYIDCEKLYCQTFWLNKKQKWDVEIRIIASLCHIYKFVTKIHHFLTGEYKNIWHRSKEKKLLINIENWQQFINQIFQRLCKIERFYYEYQYPYLLQLHEFFQVFKKLLHTFPSIHPEEVIQDLMIFDLIQKENKKFMSVFRTNLQQKVKIPYLPKNQELKKIQHRSLPKQKLKVLNQMNSIMNKKSNFRKYSHEQKLQNPILFQFTRFQEVFSLNKLRKRRRTKAFSIESMDRSNTQYASTRQITITCDANQSFSPTKDQIIFINNTKCRQSIKIDIKPRRTYNTRRNIPKVYEKINDNLLIDFNIELEEQKELNIKFLKTFYENLPNPNKESKYIFLEVQSPRQIKIDGQKSKLKMAQKKIKQILQVQEIIIQKKQIVFNKYCR